MLGAPKNASIIGKPTKDVLARPPASISAPVVSRENFKRAESAQKNQTPRANMSHGIAMLNSNEVCPEVQKKLIDSVHAEVGSRSIDELAAERDEILLGLIELRTKGAKTPAASKASTRVA